MAVRKKGSATQRVQVGDKMPPSKKAQSRKNVAGLARLHADKAIQILAKAMDNPDPRVAVEAANQILNRAIGKPVAMSADVTDRIDEFTDDELDAAIDELQSRLGAAKTTDDEAKAPAGPAQASNVLPLRKAT